MADISDLDERVRRAAEAWGLVVGDALVGGTMSAVFAATDQAGRDLVLKLPAVRDDDADPTGAEERLLHGDFITKNLVSDASSRIGWMALDPLPMTGDPAAEVAAFAAYQPAEMILPIAEALAQALGLDPRRALRWAAIWTVHQATQAWRGDQHHLERLVASATLDDLLTT